MEKLITLMRCVGARLYASYKRNAMTNINKKKRKQQQPIHKKRVDAPFLFAFTTRIEFIKIINGKIKGPARIKKKFEKETKTLLRYTQQHTSAHITTKPRTLPYLPT